ncbi:MAG: potassium transporter TrkG [Raoultibacter sp.]
MWQRFTLYDARIIGHYLGVLIMFSSFAFLVPFLTGLACGEWEPASRYFAAIGMALIVGTALRMLIVAPGRLTRQQALAITGLAWMVLACIFAVPLFFSGHFAGYLDALFDCVSALTTTGASLVIDLDHLSNADNMWRFVMHFVGGLGLIVVALSIGLFSRQADVSLYSSEGRSEHVVPNIVQTTRFIAKLAISVIAVTTACLALLCFMKGMEPSRSLFHALWLSISGFMTGGFSPMSPSVMYYHSAGIEVILMVLMLIGATNFALFSEASKGRTRPYFRDIETRTLFVWMIVMVCVLAASLSVSKLFSDLPAMLQRGLFMVVSAMTTTGFQNITTNQLVSVFSSGAFLVLACVMAVGGGAGSTAGGIKLSRVGIIAKSIAATIKEALAPDSARVVVDYYHVGRRMLTPETVKEATTVFALFIVTYTAGSLIGIAHGYEATQAIFESVTMASNGGIVAGISTPGMPITLEVVYILEMWAGRLEFITLLALLAEIVVSFKPRKSLLKIKGRWSE